MYTTTSIISLLALAGVASAHGFIQDLTIDGKFFPGANGAGGDTSKSPVRPINNGVNNGAPIDDVSSPNMACGINAKAAKVVASVKPGSKIAVHWQGPTGIHWFHAAGPIMNYMAKCDGDCTSFTPSASTQWFKISELGLKNPADLSSWYQADLNSGGAASVTIPATLAGGNYLLRQEIIATQNSQTKGGTEFYPACIQLKVDAPSSASQNPSPTVHFPGAYSPNDPGIFGNFYNPGLTYKFPGGPVSNLAAGAGTSSSSSGSSSSSKPPPPPPSAPPAYKPAPAPAPAPPVNAAPDPAAPPKPASSSHQCKNKKKNKKRADANRKREAVVSQHRKKRMSAHY